MKLHLNRSVNTHYFTGYGDGYVEINRQRHERSLVVMPGRLWSEWSGTTFAALVAADLEALAALGQEIILLGTGNVLQFPRPELMRPLIQARVGLEVMDVAAACRTYNILVDEGRKVAAALLLG